MKNCSVCTSIISKRITDTKPTNVYTAIVLQLCSSCNYTTIPLFSSYRDVVILTLTAVLTEIIFNYEII